MFERVVETGIAARGAVCAEFVEELCAAAGAGCVDLCGELLLGCDVAGLRLRGVRCL